MNNWNDYQLGEIGQIVGGGTPSSNIENLWDGDISWITPADLSGYQFKYISKGERNISELGLQASSAKLHPRNTVLMTSRAPIGYLAIAKYPLATNQGFQSIICNEDVADFNFIYYYLKASIQGIELIASGATFPEISNSKLKKFKIKLPPLLIQKKISYILSCYDNLIDNNLRRIKLLEEMGSLIYKEWFINFKVNEVNLIIDKKTGLPNGWNLIKIGNLISFKKGKKANEIYEYKKENLINLLLLSGLESNTYNYVEKDRHVIAQRGDLLMTMDGARSSAVFYAENGAVGSTMALIEVKKLSSSYLYYFFKSNYEWLEINNTGAAIPHANKLFINKMNVIDPGDEILSKWNKTIGLINSQIYNLKDQNQKLKEAKEIILPRLMTCLIDVNKIDIPA